MGKSKVFFRAVEKESLRQGELCAILVKKEGFGMKKSGICLLVLVSILLSGCGAVWSDGVVGYKDMNYERPDMASLEQTLEDAFTAAEGENLDKILEEIYDFYDAYDWFYTNYSLAEIRYCGNMKDIYWQDEYDYCVERGPQVDAMLEELYYALAKSPCRQQLEGDDYFGAGFFDSYEDGEGWDPEFLALLEKESALQGEYYDRYGASLEDDTSGKAYYDAYADELAQILVDLIRVRQQIAAYWGYADYGEYASDFYYYRDYTPAQTEAYLADIRRELVPLYRQVCQTDVWSENLDYSTEGETYAYVREMAQNMGGTVLQAFELLDKAGLYDIAYGENKYPSSYEVYLTSYWEPFIFLCPEGSTYDHLTIAHEFGHFCSDFAADGSYAGADVQEVFSQGMEYLSLCYVEDTDALTRLKMADSLFLYVEQAAFASFEQRMYGLTGEDLSVERLYGLYEEVGLEYGFDSIGFDRREFVTINHYFTDPMYIISYVVSNDGAMQLYQMELASPGAGLACFEEFIHTEEVYILSFLECYGLESPFVPGRIASVRETLEAALK